MDLHVIGPLATPAERGAVDAVLGPADSGWHGGGRNPATEGHVAGGGHEARSRRDLLLPALHALQDRVGQITQPGLNYNLPAPIGSVRRQIISRPVSADACGARSRISTSS